MKSVIFIHTATIERYTNRLKKYLNQIKLSNLYNNVEKIFICYVGKDFNFNYTELDIDNKIQVINTSSNLNDFELPTQQYIYNFSKEHKDYKILYLHTKGIHGNINDCIEDWVSYMVYFCINKWKECVMLLEKYFTVGVDLRDYPTLCYCGNFWWSTTEYISLLPEPNDFSNISKYPNPLNSQRHNQEFWICYLKKKEKYYCLWESNINCFERHLHRYLQEQYINKNDV
jgi:hypothetical protein